ncbi:MAG: ATP-binding protein [Erysipelotrichaceae bacterium]|nr:ATP-binding protein [Erysipelotrichaceae bacterium]
MSQTNQNIIPFTMGYYVLKTLGKGLYSNPWAAVSELVANSIDADADSISIIFNEKVDKYYDIYIIDNGTGMDENELTNYYAKVGHNKRNNDSKFLNSKKVMGRKGIGKLAALYLSNHYRIFTQKKPDNILKYSVNFNGLDDSDVPAMKFDENLYDEIVLMYTKDFSSFTAIHIVDVKLERYGDQAFNSLSMKLGNYFAIDSIEMSEVKIFLNKFEDSKLKSESIIEKNIAFNNMIILSNINDFKDFDFAKTSKVNVYLKKINKKIVYDKIILKDDDEMNRGEINNVPYLLKGWLGLHATISKKEAEENDLNFIKNSYYNPIQIRIYVRNKLAIENFQNYLTNTQTYANYIEGELHFDILDANELEDIATANRQDVDINDDRVQKLIRIVNEKINTLIKKRNEITAKINTDEKNEIDKINSRAKNEFSELISTSLVSLEISKESQRVIKQLVNVQLKGETVKNLYSLFFSHASGTRAYSDFVWNLLLNLGAKKSEIFYTSGQLPGLASRQLAISLNEQIKNNIMEENSMIVFFNTPTFNSSQFCMFEGGAGWATKSKQLILIIADNYLSIPEYLKVNDPIVTEVTGNLNSKNYEILISSINAMIEHLNKGRKIHNEVLIQSLNVCDIPDDVTILKRGKTVEDYYDPLFKQYWAHYQEKIHSTTEKQCKARDAQVAFHDILKDINT